MSEINVNFTEDYCPKCKASLLTDGTKKWCSFIGAGINYPACDYGVTEVIYVDTEGK